MNETPATVDVSILVPAKDEALNLPELITLCRDALDPAPFSFEVIVVDDGSRDDSAQVLEALQAEHPFLVGKELYDGELSKKIGAATSTSTMRFSAAKFCEEPVSAKADIDVDGDKKGVEGNKYGGITHAVYTLKKRKFSSPEENNIIKIGRAQENDIVIADFVISKSHAQIVIFHNMYGKVAT